MYFELPSISLAFDAVVANFHDDEPGMLGRHYTVDVDWGDNGHSGGQAWTLDGQGHWVATGSHTYVSPGQYDVTVTITDTRHPPTSMSTSTVSHVSVDGPSAPSRGFFVTAFVSQQATHVSLNHPQREGTLFREGVPTSAAVVPASYSLGSVAAPVTDSVIDLLHSRRAVTALPALLDPLDPEVADILALNLLPG